MSTPRSLAAALALALATPLLAQQPLPAALAKHLEVGRGTQQRLSWQPAERELAIPVVLDRARTLRLRPFDVRSPSCRLLVDDGRALREVPLPAAATWRGRLDGEPDSAVAATVTGSRIEAVVRIGSAPHLWVIQPAGAFDPRLHAVFTTRDNRPLAGRCGTSGHAAPAAGGAVHEQGNLIAELACEADYEFYQQNGRSVAAAQTDITTVVNGLDVIYQRDVQIQHTITTIVVQTAPGTYTTNDPGGLLSQFTSHWRANHRSVQRDAAHLFTGRNLSGSVIGIAYLAVICNGAYGVSQSRFTSNLGSRVALTAHELGHNWAADHCNGTAGCQIMCSFLGGCGGLGAFGPSARAQIDAFKVTRGCLGNAILPQLTSIQPPATTVFGATRHRITGQDLDYVYELAVGPTTLRLGTGFDLLDPQTIEFTAPTAAALGPESVRATGLTGPSNALSWSRAETSPPALDVPFLGAGGYDLRLRFGGRVAGSWYALVAFGDPSTFTFAGATVLRNFALLGAGTLDAVGLGTLAVPLPVGVLAGTTLYTQIVELRTGAVLEGVSPIRSTVIIR